MGDDMQHTGDLAGENSEGSLCWVVMRFCEQVSQSVSLHALEVSGPTPLLLVLSTGTHTSASAIARTTSGISASMSASISASVHQHQYQAPAPTVVRAQVAGSTAGRSSPQPLQKRTR